MTFYDLTLVAKSATITKYKIIGQCGVLEERSNLIYKCVNKIEI